MFGSLLSTQTFTSFTDLVRKTFVPMTQRVPTTALSLFIKQDIPSGNGNSKRFDEIDTQTYARLKREAQAVQKASIGIGYNKTMTKKRVGYEIDITYEMRMENRNAEVAGLLTNLAEFVPQRMALDATHRLTFATSTSYVDMDGDTVDVSGGDALSIVNTTHTLRFSSLTWSNRVTGDPAFSKTGFETALALTVTDIYSNLGERRVLNFNTIISGDDPSTVSSIKQFLNSMSDNTQNNSSVVNVYKGVFNHIIVPQLATTATGAYDSTKRRWWFLGAINQGTNGLQAYMGMWENARLLAPSEGDLTDNHRDVWTYGCRGGYGFVIVSGKGLVGSHPVS